jgi:hypothetical protein
MEPPAPRWRGEFAGASGPGTYLYTRIFYLLIWKYRTFQESESARIAMMAMIAGARCR